MDLGFARGYLRPVGRSVGHRYQKRGIDRNLPAIPDGGIVPVEDTSDVILVCSRRSLVDVVPNAYAAERAYGYEFAVRGRPVAITEDARELFDKTVVWFIPGTGRDFVSPGLWDYSRQVREFAAGLEAQGNRLLCSAHETAFWENKAFMHRRLEEIGAATPSTTIVTAENRSDFTLDIEPVLIKEEHSAGSAGLHHFPTADEARKFVQSHRFRPGESLIMQEVVPGATKDLRLTMVGDRMIDEATYWRKKSSAALQSSKWTPTATSFGSTVEHGDIPDSAPRLAAEYLRKLGIRTAGIDLIWEDDDLSRDPLILELSPYYYPNPPKPERYTDWSYKQYKKKRRNVKEGYLVQQYLVYRRIAAAALDQGLV